MEKLKKQVFDLIEENEDFQAQLNETRENVSSPILEVITVQTCTDLLLSNKFGSLPTASVVAAEIARHVHEVIASSTEQAIQPLSSDRIGKLNLLIGVASKLIRQNQCDVDEFRKCIGRGIALPLELLSLLHASNLLSYGEYILLNVGKAAIIQNFAKRLVYHCQRPVAKMMTIVADIVSVLINHSSEAAASQIRDASAKKMKKVAEVILNALARKITELVSATNDAIVNVNVFETIVTQSLVDRKIIKGFFSKQLVFMLTHNATIKVSQAFAEQSSWSFSSVPGHLTGVFQQLLLVFEDADEVVALLTSTLESREVNWMMVLLFTSTLLVCYPQAIPLMKDVISNYVKIGTEESSTEKLITAFLLARQACSEGSHVFCSYSDWFQTCFGSPDGATNNRKNFMFLVKFLSDILPHEHIKFAKIHIKSSPFVPSTCKSNWQQYVALVRLKLGEMDEGCERSNGKTAASSGDLAKAETMLDEALLAYEKNSKVPISIMELSIFRKPFFVGQFLPVLLRSRILPDSPDIKMKLISDLNSSGKIPVNIMNDYEENCRKERDKLLNDLVCDDVMMVDEVFDPMESLRLMAEEFKAITDGDDNLSSRCLSSASAKLKWIAGELSANKEDITDEIVLFNQPRRSNQSETQVAVALLEIFSTFPTDGVNGERFLAMLSDHSKILRLIYQYLYDWASCLEENERFQLSNETFALLAFFIAKKAGTFDKVRVSANESPAFVLDLMFDILDVSSIRGARKTLEICSCFVGFVKKRRVTFQDIQIPIMFAKKYQYCALRSCASLRAIHENPNENHRPDDEKNAAYRYVLSNSSESLRLGFTDWFAYEIMSNPDEGPKERERMKYHQWITMHFLRCLEASDGFAGSYRIACSKLFKALTNASSSSPSYAHLSTLLQAFTLSLDPTGSTDLPWLLNELTANSIAGIELAYSLPPYLLVCNLPGFGISSVAINGLISLLNDSCKNVMVSLGNTYDLLPPEFILHILKGLSQSKAPCTVFDQLFDQAPILPASIIYHWSSFDRVIKNLAPIRNIAEFEKCSEIADRFIASGVTACDDGIDDWKVALGIHRASRYQTKAAFENLNQTVLEAVIMFKLADGASEFICLSSARTKPSTNLLELLRLCDCTAVAESVFNVYVNQSRFCLLLPQIIIDVIPFMAFRFIIDKLINVGRCPVANIEPIVKLHRACAEQVDAFGSKDVAPALQQILLTYSFRFVKFLEKCDVGCLKAITQETIASSREDVAQVIKCRLAT